MEQEIPPRGSQTLLRGLRIIEAVASGAASLAALSKAVGTTRTTTYRLATALVGFSYLRHLSGHGYALGPKLIELGFGALKELDLPKVAQPYLQDLARKTEDTVHLAVRDGVEVLYLEKVSGNRRVELSSRIGERQPVWSTGVGKALILDESEKTWRMYFGRPPAKGPKQAKDVSQWLELMRDYAKKGYALDLEENEPQVCCIAFPIRDASGKIAASISLSSLLVYVDGNRMNKLLPEIRDVAEQISRELGWLQEMSKTNLR